VTVSLNAYAWLDTEVDGDTWARVVSHV